MTSASNRPVRSALSNVRKMTRTLSNLPDLHSSRNSVRFVAVEVIRSARGARLSHDGWALRLSLY